jgi:hypothetical protein
VAVLNQNVQSQIYELNEYKSVNIFCPVCKSKKELKFPKLIINKSRQLTTISIPKGLICDHHFQAFLDTNFAVRGYQKVDFEFAYDLINNNKKSKNKLNDKKLLDNLILEGNYVGYKLENTNKAKKKNLFITEEVINSPKKVKNIPKQPLLENTNKRKKMTLKEIYEEFWEFIDNDNNDFKDFIQKDSRRTNL